MTTNSDNDETEFPRRLVLQGAGAALVAGLATAAAMPSAADSAAPDARPLGARLQGVQHFGLTVQNMDRAYAFYTEVLGGTEVMRDGDFYDERIHNTLLTDQEIEARVRGVNP